MSGFSQAIAAQLVFKPTARPVDLLALAPALDLEVRELSFGRLHPWGVDPDEEDSIDNQEESDSETGEAIFGHSPFTPDPSRNVPKPGQIRSDVRPVTKRRGGKQGQSMKAKAGTDNDQASEIEEQHIERLKRDHYASHCQMCLCERSPLDLAPAGSYVEWEEVRRRVVQAHHVDLKSGGGARHAGNLILLCKLHHDNYGRRLTRDAVTAALRKTGSKKVLRFGANDASESQVTGYVIRVEIPDSGDIVALFFTDEHVGYWLSEARPD